MRRLWNTDSGRYDLLLDPFCFHNSAPTTTTIWLRYGLPCVLQAQLVPESFFTDVFGEEIFEERVSV